MAELLHVQVCYARPDRCWLRDVMVAEGCSLREAIVRSGILDEAPEINLTDWRVGVYGKLKTIDTVLRDRDRVEIYRPLQADPKESRRRRADTKKTREGSPGG